MDLRATKDTHEREEDEAQRLVRPAPKIKPPRHDLHRETTRPERDSDTAGDPDLKGDPDLSLNYKTVGGSVQRVVDRTLARSVLLRYVQANGPRSDLITVRLKEDPSRVVHVTEETLRKEPGRYEKIEDKEEESGGGKFSEAGKKLRELAEKEPQLARRLETLKDPDSPLSQSAQMVPDGPILNFFSKKWLPNFPEELKTIGDVYEAYTSKAPPKPKEPDPQPTWETEQKDPVQEAPAAPAKRDESDLKSLAKSSPEVRALVEQFNDPDADVRGELESADPSTPISDILVDEIAAALPKTLRNVGDLLGALKPKNLLKKKTPKAPPAESTQEEKKPDQAEGKPKEEGGEKPAPEAKKKPASKDLSDEDQKELDEWLSSSSGEEFRAFAEKDDTVGEDEEGNPTFYDAKTKTKVPFNKLPPGSKLEWARKFQQQKDHSESIKALSDVARRDTSVSKALAEWADPKSKARQELAKNRKDPSIMEVGKVIPGLKGKLPKGIQSLKDLIDLVQRVKLPKEPPRREATPEEQQAAAEVIIDAFPPEMAADLLARNLHPDDVRSLVSTYNDAKNKAPKKLGDLVEHAAKFYETNPDAVKPPKNGKNEKGEEVPWEMLSPDRQAEVFREHQLRTVALSLAARGEVSRKLEEAGAPEELANTLSGFMLRSSPNESDEIRLKRAQKASRAFFVDTLGSGTGPLLSDGDARRLIETMSHDPAAQAIAVGFLQAQHYQAARERFLDPDSDDAISEQQDPEEFVRNLRKAQDFLKGKEKLYPKNSTSLNVPLVFRTRVLQQLRNVAPEKYPLVRERLQLFDNSEYEDAHRRYEKEKAKYDKERERVEKEYNRENDKYQSSRSGGPYRGVPDKKPPKTVEERLKEKGVEEPEEPKKPYGYKPGDEKPARGKDKKKAPKKPKNQDPWKEHSEQFDTEEDLPEDSSEWLRDEPEPQRMVMSHDSSYSPGSTMGQTPSEHPKTAGNRQAVYWGVAPYPRGHEGFAVYEKWQQAQARDLGDQDFKTILAAARDWLKQPVLANEIEGIRKDTQLRAALDLAIRDCEGGRYSSGLHPALYDELLGKLASGSDAESVQIRLLIKQTMAKTL